MKNGFSRLLFFVVFLGFSRYGSAQSESDQISLEQVRLLCSQWAEEDGLEGSEIPQYLETCIREEMESMGLQLPVNTEANDS
jgi:hypothetical protein